MFDEEWDTKILQPANGGGGGGFGGPAATQQDVFSYWIPVDTRFQQLMVKFSQIYPCEYLSPYPGDYYFFAYLTWTPQLDNLTFFQLHNILNPSISQNMANGTVTPTGAAYAQLASASTIPEFSLWIAPTAFLMIVTITLAVLKRQLKHITNLR